MDVADLKPYIDHLRALPFVRGVRVLSAVRGGRRLADYELVVRTAAGETHMHVELKTSHVSPEVIERWAGTVGKARDHLLFAPAISQQLGDRLEEGGLGFVDRAGNCYVNLAGHHVARIQGKRGERRAPAEKALRAPAYRALFALLADPKLAGAPVRALAEAAGVSRQAAFDIRPRLEALRFLYANEQRFGWVQRNAPKAIDLFIAGYATTLRPQLMLGRYRTPASNPDELEVSIGKVLRKTDGALWGGGAAAMRLTRHYRGARTILHIEQLSPEFLKRLKAIPDRNGPLEIVRFPGPTATRGATDDTVHPLLVYAELILEGEERARETAQEILERWFPPEHYA